jgi:hypothetical protein
MLSFINFLFLFNRSNSPKLNKSKKFKQENNNYSNSNSNYLQLTDELLNHYIQAKQLETTYTLKWKLCQDLFSMFIGIVPSKIQTIEMEIFKKNIV